MQVKNKVSQKKKSSVLAKAKAYLVQGNEARDRGDLSSAISYYQDSIELKPDLIRSILNLAEVYAFNKDWAAATRCYRRLIGLNPDNHNFYIRLAKVLTPQNKIYGAIAAYEEAISLSSDVPARIYKNYADLLLQKNGPTIDAIKSYRKAASIKQDWSVGFHRKLARLYERERNYDEAVKEYQKTISLQPDNAGLYVALGNILTKQEKLTDAAKNYQKSISLDPLNSLAYKKLGDLFKVKNQFENALKCYQKTLEIQPDFKAVYQSIGDIFKMQGKLDSAEKCYQRAS